MDQFEKQFEDLDVQSEYVENAMNQTTTLSTPADQVPKLDTFFMLFLISTLFVIFRWIC